MVFGFIITYAISGFIITYAIGALSPLMLWVRIPLRWGVLNTTLCDKECQWYAAGQWFSPGTPVSSPNKTDHYNIAENYITLTREQILH